MGANQIALHVADRYLSAPSFQIHRCSCRHLDLEIHIADFAAATIVADNIDYQSGVGLARIEVHRGSVHLRGDFDLIALPGFNRDRARKVFQLESNILSGRKVTRHAMLCEGAGGKDQNQQRGNQRRLFVCSDCVDGWVDIHRAIINLGAFDFAHSLQFGKLL